MVSGVFDFSESHSSIMSSLPTASEPPSPDSSSSDSSKSSDGGCLSAYEVWRGPPTLYELKSHEQEAHLCLYRGCPKEYKALRRLNLLPEVPTTLGDASTQSLQQACATLRAMRDQYWKTTTGDNNTRRLVIDIITDKFSERLGTGWTMDEDNARIEK